MVPYFVLRDSPEPTTKRCAMGLLLDSMQVASSGLKYFLNDITGIRGLQPRLSTPTINAPSVQINQFGPRFFIVGHRPMQ
jgi:hypothetical protein